MIERIKDCICHPRSIGKYHKDKAGIVILTIVLFFVLAISVQAVRCFTENPFDEYSSLAVTSAIIQHGDNTVVYDAKENKLTGESILVDGSGFKLIILPTEEKISVGRDSINIVLKEEEAYIYYGITKVSKIAYKDIRMGGFHLGAVAMNSPSDTYNFRGFIDQILDSSKVYFQASTFVRGALMTFVYYIICVFFCYILSISINPTIDRRVRAKLSFYDGCVFLVGSFFSYLFNVSIIVYFALALPLVYALITFRHIIKVVIRR